MKKFFCNFPIIHLSLAVVLLLVFSTVHSQPSRSNNINWSSNYGYQNDDGFLISILTADQHIVSFGFTSYLLPDSLPNLIDIPQPYLVKATTGGDVIWEHVYSHIEGFGIDILETDDGGFLLSAYRYIDLLPNETIIFKTDASGQLQWQQNYTYRLHIVLQTTDGGYFLAGNTEETNYLPQHADYVLVKIDSVGNIQNQSQFGSDDRDYFADCKPTPDGGFIITGTKGFFDFDYSVCKVDQQGNMQWFHTFGGSNLDESRSIRIFDDGSFIIAGHSLSVDAMIQNYGEYDLWLLKSDSTGIILWEQNYGGSSNEMYPTIIPSSDGRSMITAYTMSNDYDVSHNNGYYDGWMLEIDSSGNLLWEETFGGSSFDYLHDIIPLDSLNYLLAGKSTSKNGDLPANFGGSDSWLISVAPDINVKSPNIAPTHNSHLTIFPNPANDHIRLLNEAGNNLNGKQYHIYNVNGTVVLSGALTNNVINTRTLTPGIYNIIIKGRACSFIIKR